MIQHHYESICGTKNYAPKNNIAITEIDSDFEDNTLVVIDDLGQAQTVGKVLNIYYYSHVALSADEFIKMVAQEVQKVQGFEYIDTEYLKAAQVIEELAV